MKKIKIQKALMASLIILAVVASISAYTCLPVSSFSHILIFSAVIYGIGLVLFVVEMMISANWSKAKERKRSRLETEAQPVVALELEKVSGNWYKKELVKRRLVREYVESHWHSLPDKNTDNLTNWSLTVMLCSIILALPITALMAIKLAWLLILLVPMIPICPASFKAAFRHASYPPLKR